MGISKKEERNYAQILFVSEGLKAKEIAERTGTAERTVNRWIKEGGWERLKKSLLVTKNRQISMLYDQLEHLNETIAARERKTADAKEADIISKITTSIQRLEVETSIGQIIETADKFLSFVREYNVDLAKEITAHFDGFIQHKLKSNG
jgi:transposase